jgi:hypothetical protein
VLGALRASTPVKAALAGRIACPRTKEAV